MAGFSMADFTSHASGLTIYRLSLLMDEADQVLREARLSFFNGQPDISLLDVLFSTLYDDVFSNVKCVIYGKKDETKIEDYFEQYIEYREVLDMPYETRPVKHITNAQIYRLCLNILWKIKEAIVSYMQKFKFWFRTEMSSGRGMMALPIEGDDGEGD